MYKKKFLSERRHRIIEEHILFVPKAPAMNYKASAQRLVNVLNKVSKICVVTGKN